jgi:LL-diaminopimelate aminotransferase
LIGDAGQIGSAWVRYGAAGEGYVRISAFNSRENVEQAVARIRKAFGD